jgi:hypothetical protein
MTIMIKKLMPLLLAAARIASCSALEDVGAFAAGGSSGK